MNDIDHFNSSDATPWRSYGKMEHQQLLGISTFNEDKVKAGIALSETKRIELIEQV
jgi:hypothetical protein